MMVADQPTAVEDLQGRPFAGPAGELLLSLMAQAGIDRTHTWLTYAVKHFRWEPSGRNRTRKAPGQRELAACRVWLDEELRRVSPSVVVALGATAARALIGPGTTVDAARSAGPVLRAGVTLVVTYHPSALLRQPDAPGKVALREALVKDLEQVASLLAVQGGSADRVDRVLPVPRDTRKGASVRRRTR
jgi:DNA polymerase